MPNPAWENLDDFLQPDDFATTASITLLDNSVIEVVGIFDDPYLHAELGEYDLDSSAPRFTCKEVDVVNVQRGCTVVIGGITYDVLTWPKSDGVGMAMLQLATQDPSS